MLRAARRKRICTLGSLPPRYTASPPPLGDLESQRGASAMMGFLGKKSSVGGGIDMIMKTNVDMNVDQFEVLHNSARLV